MSKLAFAVALAIGLSVPGASAFAQVAASPSASIIAQQTAEQNAEALGIAREIVALSYPPEQREQTMRQLLDTMLTQYREAMTPDLRDEGLNAILENFMNSLPERLMPLLNRHMPQLLEATAQAYVREFSLDEIRQIHAFTQTPTGSHMVSRSTAVFGDPSVAAANHAYLTDLRGLMEEARVEIQTQVQAYLSKRRPG